MRRGAKAKAKVLVLEQLVGMRDWFALPSRWCRGVAAVDASGLRVRPGGASAASRCLYGYAVWRGVEVETLDALVASGRALGLVGPLVESVVVVNDRCADHEMLLGVIDGAIRSVRSSDGPSDPESC